MATGNTCTKMGGDRPRSFRVLRADRRTDEYTDILIRRCRTFPGGEVKILGTAKDIHALMMPTYGSFHDTAAALDFR